MNCPIEMKRNVYFTTKNDLCTGCGICEDVCPKHCIVISCINGENKPVVDNNACLGDKCGRCLKVCPGVGIDLKDRSKTLYSGDRVKQDEYIGRYYALHAGYSLDGDIRFHSASGGIVSQFLIFLLDKRIIDGAVVTAFSDKDHITPVSYIARTKDDILRAKSSKYCPVALNKVGNEIVKNDGRYVIVGLPCHIQGFRKRAQIDRAFRERVVGYFSIYCSSNRTFNAQDFLIRKYEAQKEDITYFAYRDNGCLGSMVIEQTSCNGKESRTSVPFDHYYGALRSFFKPKRCLTCIDHYGELADVCFGDIHIPPYSDDKIGISSWIVRTPYFEILFKQAEKDGYIKQNDLNADILNESQKAMLYPKQRRAHAAMNMERLFGREIAIYGCPLEKPHMKDYISEVVSHCQRFIGRHRRLWWIIDLFYDRRVGKL